MEITLWNPPPLCQFPSQPRIASWGCLPTSLYPLAELWHQPKANKSRPLVGLGLVLSLWDLCSSEDLILWVLCNPLGLSAQNQPTPGRDLPHQENPICLWLLGPSGWLDCWLLIFLSNIVEKKGIYCHLEFGSLHFFFFFLARKQKLAKRGLSKLWFQPHLPLQQGGERPLQALPPTWVGAQAFFFPWGKWKSPCLEQTPTKQTPSTGRCPHRQFCAQHASLSTLHVAQVFHLLVHQKHRTPRTRASL